MAQNSIAALSEIRQLVATGGDVDTSAVRLMAAAAVSDVRDQVDRDLLLGQLEALFAAIMISEAYGSSAETERKALLDTLEEVLRVLRR